MKRLFCTVALCVLTSVSGRAVEPKTCDDALRAGALPWQVLRRVRELALAHVQVALHLGSSDLGPARTLVFHDGVSETFTVWVEVSPPEHVTQYVRVVMDPEFKIGVAHAKSHPGNEAAQLFADWGKAEARALQAPNPSGRRRRMVSLFARPAGPVATLEPEPGFEYQPERQVVALRDLPDAPPRPVVQLPPSQHLMIQSVANAYLLHLHPQAGRVDFKMTRVEVGPGRAARARIQREVPGSDFWVLLDEKNTPLIDLNDEPGGTADFTAMQTEVRNFIFSRARTAQVTGVDLIRRDDQITARVHVFEAISTAVKIFGVYPEGEGFTVSEQ